VLLLDDPLRNVDAKLRYEMRQEIPRLIKEARVAAIYVTQDYREAMALGDKIAVLDANRVVQYADPTEIYDSPTTVSVARLFGDPPINLIPAAKLSGVARFAPGGGILPEGANAADLTFGIRPQAFSINRASTPGSLEGRIVALTPIHNRIVALVRLNSGPEVLASLAEASEQLAVGEVSMDVDASQVLIFDSSSGVRNEKRAAA
jgi:multiple sugar transport system ATP-binding protein